MQENTKKKHAFWLSPETKAKIESMYPQDNCKSQSEFVENAVRFYCGYLAARDSSEYLARTLLETLRGMLDSLSAHINRNLFRLSVETAITENILAAGLEMRYDELQKLRGRCIAEVKRTNGRLSFEDNLRFQRGEDLD